jgi:hypothetical protein
MKLVADYESDNASSSEDSSSICLTKEKESTDECLSEKQISKRKREFDLFLLKDDIPEDDEMVLPKAGKKPSFEIKRLVGQEEYFNDVHETTHKVFLNEVEQEQPQQQQVDHLQLDEKARAQLGLKRSEQIPKDQLKSISRLEQTNLQPHEKNASIKMAPYLKNSTFRQRHNIRWLAKQADLLGQELEERAVESKKKRAVSKFKYGY